MQDHPEPVGAVVLLSIGKRFRKRFVGRFCFGRRTVCVDWFGSPLALILFQRFSSDWCPEHRFLRIDTRKTFSKSLKPVFLKQKTFAKICFLPFRSKEKEKWKRHYNHHQSRHQRNIWNLPFSLPISLPNEICIANTLKIKTSCHFWNFL